MPICYPSQAGKPYRPSNGTEGDLFQMQFCDRCTKEHGKNNNVCEIVLLTMCHDEQDAAYPAEWKFDEAGRPVCTAFEKINK